MKAKSILLVVRQDIQTRIMIRKKAVFFTTPIASIVLQITRFLFCFSTYFSGISKNLQSHNGDMDVIPEWKLNLNLSGDVPLAT